MPASLISEEVLQRFANGQLEPALQQQVVDYLERHPEIFDKLDSQSSNRLRTKLKAVKQLAESVELPKKKEVIQAVAVKPTAKDELENVPPQLASYPGYKVIKELGRGGMGVVYLAKNIPMDRLEVLKVLNERLLNHAGAKERFLREIRAVSKLNHPCIVTSYSILPLNNLLVFAMEFVNGTDLFKLIQKHRVLPIALACNFARQLAAGLQHAYEKKLVHRDIKPSNAIVYKVDGQFQLKILDFGLAKASSEEAAGNLTQDGTMLGTPEYMAPEQTLDAAKADIRADIYSLGCTLYHMLTGRPPFVGTHGQVIIAHSQREPQALHLLRPEVPLELVTVVSKMLAKDPTKRYQLPSDVHAALAPFLDVKTSRTSPDSRPQMATSTVTDLSSPLRDTSVEVAPAASASSFSQLDLASLPMPTQGNYAAPGIPSAYLPRKPKAARPAWFTAGVIFASVLSGLALLGLLGIFFFRTADGTIVIEHMPKDASVEIDGQQMTVTWNAGQDTAVVSIEAGTHMLKVLNQGNVIHGQQLTVKGGDQTSIKLALHANSSPAASPPAVPAPETLASASNSSTDEANERARSPEPILPNVPVTPPPPTESSMPPEPPAAAAAANKPAPPAVVTQYRSLFNGVDLTGWQGRPEADPQSWKTASVQQQNAWDTEARKSWRVNAGDIVFRGKGLPLTTQSDFGDIELVLQYKATRRSDSGINLRGSPQVQIWDWTDPEKAAIGAERGSGGLYNNDPQTAGRDPLVRADKPFGQWNVMRILQVGSVTSVWLNDQLVVDKAQMKNHWNPGKPLPDRGPIQLQAFSGEVHFRKILVREIDPAEASYYLKVTSAKELILPDYENSTALAGQASNPGNWQPLFDGQSLNGWTGVNQYWSVKDGAITGRFDSGNTPAKNTCLVWEGGTPADFELEARFRFLGRGNSGIHVRSDYVDRATSVLRGYQADFDFENKFTGSWYEEAARGSMAGRGTWTTFPTAGQPIVSQPKPPQDAIVNLPAGQWNQIRIVASGAHLSYYFNDRWMSHLLDLSPERKSSGLLALQLHRREPLEIQFKDLRLRDLSGLTNPEFSAGSQWRSQGSPEIVLTVSGRTQDTFQGLLTINTGIRRQLSGSIKNGLVEWLYRDVNALQGGPGGDNVGIISQDGSKIDFAWRKDELCGTFTLYRQP